MFLAGYVLCCVDSAVDKVHKLSQICDVDDSFMSLPLDIQITQNLVRRRLEALKALSGDVLRVQIPILTMCLDVYPFSHNHGSVHNYPLHEFGKEIYWRYTHFPRKTP